MISDETKERMAETRRRWWANERKARRKLGAPQRGGTLPAAAATAAAAAKERKTGRGEKGPELDALSSLDGELDDPLDDSVPNGWTIAYTQDLSNPACKCPENT